jgi:C-terminal processing protease CtpA/Prc
MGYPSETSNLQLGDIILGISPNNDETMMSMFNMPPNQVSHLILGQRGTKLKLKVAHLAGWEEEVIVERN